MSAEHVPASLQRRVRLRAGDRCEYCRLSQVSQEATFHVDHVVPRIAGGRSVMENLALACVSCSLRKASRTAVVDPETGHGTPVFHPRVHVWREHFAAAGAGELLGLTAIGRGTIAALAMNRPIAVAIRREEHLRERWP